MRLKRVRIFGFKTFADRTDIDFSGNLTAIVGPNGSGKSNLVDAILWCLGEANSRQLRAQTSQDVIFSGSSKRKPVGYCEVTLLFDNEDGALPVATPEVAVTRRLDRSGQSLYLINRQPCRLKDVLDLFADSGLGRAGYAIVGQKEVDQALAASAEERRAWVDEAAGVQRYRARKIDSQRRLASAQEHLARTKDILREIEAQRDPLRAEAEQARRYKTLLESLRKVECGLLARELAAAKNEIHALEEARSKALKLAEGEAKRADDLEMTSDRIAREVRKLEECAERLRHKVQAESSSAERAEATIRLCNQRLESLEELEASLQGESDAQQERIAEAREEVQRAEELLQRETETLRSLQTELAGADEEASRLQSALAGIEKELEEGRRRNTQRQKTLAEIGHRKERLRELDRELAGIESTMPQLTVGVEEAQSRYQGLLERARRMEQELHRLRTELGQLGKEEEREVVRLRALLAELAALEGRKRGIEATIDSHEGLQQGARAVLLASEAGHLPKGFRPVAESLEVDKRYATAIDTALGSAANDLIVPTEVEAKRAIGWLKAQRAGRVTFQPLSMVRGMAPSAELMRVARQPGVVGRASELVRCDPELRPVLDSLLGRILVVETLDDAIKLAKTSGWSRLVTLDGEVVHSSGAVTGGTSARSSFGMVQRKAELAEVRNSLERLACRVSEQENSIVALRSRADSIRTLMEEIQAELEAGLDERREAKSFLDQLSAELHSLERERERLLREVERLRTSPDELPEPVDLEELEKRRDEAVALLASRAADAEAAQRLLRAAAQRVEEAKERLRTARRRVDALTESQLARVRRFDAIGPERERILQDRQASLEAKEAALREAERAECQLANTLDQREKLLAEVDDLRKAAKDAREGARAAAEGAHHAELARARWEGRKATALQRLLEDYSLTEDEAIAMGQSVEVPEDAPSLVGRLRRELRSMGDVNLGAIEAFERLTSRAEELGAQVGDIEEGIRQIEAGIRELDRLTQDRFASTFERLEAAFAETFHKLFGGGAGSLRLSAPGNLLDTGIEIEVTLPGKKRQRLELLSGGERALCAAAFLFALLKVKPSPIVVLDEIDAPLDGRNVERFIDLLRELQGNMQFILITHNHVTILAADNWIGVTMQGHDGVSTIVPVNVAALAEAADGG